MNLKKTALLVVLLLAADQALKIWVKTHMQIGDPAIMIFPDWFQLRFIENPGMAFGLRLRMGGAYDWGKLLLGLFRILFSGWLGWYIIRTVRERKVPAGVVVGLTLILAGAVGNLIDSAFYGLCFSESTPCTVAHFGGSYAGFMMGRVVDMLYFPLFRWESVPEWLSFLVDRNGYFFGPIFNLADAYISVAVVYLLLFQFRYLNK